jgi:uncharacterized protein YbcI
MDQAQLTPVPADAQVSVLASISREMVRLYKQQFGRGPTKARTDWCGQDTLITILEDTLTPAENNMMKLGEHQRLRELRLMFQYASVAEFCEPVERLTGRTVRSFLSATDASVEGLSMETFVLYPIGQEGPSRAELGG